MKVLIVDDSDAAVALAKARLAGEGHQILCARGGLPGLETARRERPDLVLLDIDMPDLSGYDVCRALKSDPQLCIIPVIFLSGANDAEDKVRGLDMGAVDFVTKPFDAFELRARVRAALRTKHLQDLLIEHAHVDPLTGLPNRRALMDRLQQEWARIRRHGGVVSLIMADIDHFKTVNDMYGHSIGDTVLQAVAAAIAAQCRATDMPARYGGEEFAVVAAESAAPNAALLAERCRQAVQSAAVQVNNTLVRVTASLGVVDSTAVESVAALVAAADRHLYAAKNAGRNVVQGPQSASDCPS
jgi:diguanylate cyclase (GGDEF)-like protein